MATTGWNHNQTRTTHGRLLAFTLIMSLAASIVVAQEPLLLDVDRDKSSKPNVIMLMADDLGYGDVGFTGNKKIITPHLDAMAKHGVTFDHFYAASCLCTPTRASCLTGRSPFRQGIFAAHTAGMRHAEKTVAESLRSENYATGFFGKWHLGWVEADKVESRGFYSPPWHHGFDEVFATKSAVPTWNPTRTPKNWKGFGAEDDGSWGGSIYVHNGVPVTENLDGDDSRIIMDRAIPFIEKSLADNKPFLATIWFHAPHDPVVAGPEYLAQYPDLPEKQQHLYGCITAMDEQIGRLQEVLQSHDAAENTIVFFCSDNGPSDSAAKKGIASAGPFRGHKHQMWEGGIRVPSLVQWQGHLKESAVCSFPATTCDYLPTILDLAGLRKIENRPLDGVSLKPVLQGRDVQREYPMAFGYQRLYKNTELYALLSGSYKICIPEKETEMMLFDLANDPSETKDISKEQPERFEQMKSELQKVKQSWRQSREGNDYTY